MATRADLLGSGTIDLGGFMNNQYDSYGYNPSMKAPEQPDMGPLMQILSMFANMQGNELQAATSKEISANNLAATVNENKKMEDRKLAERMFDIDQEVTKVNRDYVATNNKANPFLLERARFMKDRKYSVSTTDHQELARLDRAAEAWENERTTNSGMMKQQLTDLQNQKAFYKPSVNTGSTEVQGPVMDKPVATTTPEAQPVPSATVVEKPSEGVPTTSGSPMYTDTLRMLETQDITKIKPSAEETISALEKSTNYKKLMPEEQENLKSVIKQKYSEKQPEVAPDKQDRVQDLLKQQMKTLGINKTVPEFKRSINSARKTYDNMVKMGWRGGYTFEEWFTKNYLDAFGQDFVNLVGQVGTLS